MAKKKVTEEVIIETAEVEELKRPSLAQIEFMAMMESYKKSNPVKYAQKEEAFIKKLNSL